MKPRGRAQTALWGLLVALALAGAVGVATWLMPPGGSGGTGSDAVEASDPGSSEMTPGARRAVAIWIQDERCPEGRADALAQAAQAVVDRWPEFEALDPAVVRGLVDSEGPVSQADLLELGNVRGWRVLVAGRCGTRDGDDGVAATIYDLRWDPPIRSGPDIEVTPTGEDDIHLLDNWQRLLTTRIWGLMPMGCEGPSVQLPTRDAARLLSQARSLIPRYTREDLEEALRLVEQALEQAPGAPDGRLLKAQLLFHLVDRFAANSGLLDLALDEAAAVAKVCPGHRRVHSLRAIVHAKRGDSQTAIRLLQEGLDRFPTDPISWNFLAVELGIVGRAEEKVDALRRILGRVPRDRRARINLGYTLRQLGKSDAAVAEYEQVLEGGASLDERLWAWDGLLWTALSRGDREAAGAARDALQSERSEHWTLESAAALAWFEGRCEDAASLGRRARAKSSGAWIGALWTVMASLGDPRCGGGGAAVGAAMELTSDALHWPPTARLVLGLLLDTMNRSSASESVLRSLSVARRSLAAEAAAVRACREGNAAAALAQIDRALGEDSSDAAARLRQRAWRIRILGALGRYDEAVLLGESCKALVAAPDWWMFPGQPPRPEAWASVLALKTPDRARRLADAATLFEPMDPEAWLALGLAARLQGDAAAEAEAKRRYHLLNPAPEWMEQDCGATDFEPLRRLAVEWLGD